MNDLDRMRMTQAAKEFNPDLLFRSRCEEISGWVNNNVFEEVYSTDVGTDAVVIGTRWEDSWKQGHLGTKILKSRLVAKGNQEDSSDLNTYAPTSKEVLMLMTSLASTNRWRIETMDVEKAFLQSRELRREVYLRPPKEAVGDDKSTLWRIKTAVYGLADAAREWYLSIRKILTELEFTESKLEPSLFYLQNNQKELEGVVCMHVDDLFMAGNRIFQAKVQMLKERIKIGKHKTGQFTFCGMKFQQEPNHEKNVTVDPSKLNQLTTITIVGDQNRRLTQD